MPDLIFAGIGDVNGDGVFDRLRVSGDETLGFAARIELMAADGSVTSQVIPAETLFTTDADHTLQNVSVSLAPLRDESAGPDHLQRGGRVTVPFNGPGLANGDCNTNKFLLWRGSLDGWNRADIKDTWSLIACADGAEKTTPQLRQTDDGTAKTIHFRRAP